MGNNLCNLRCVRRSAKGGIALQKQVAQYLVQGCQYFIALINTLLEVKVDKHGYSVYHNWGDKHMTKYINEFIFCLNEGDCAKDTQDRLDSLFGSMADKTITYGGLVK